MSSKPRILALHGFRTSATVFQSQIALAALKRFFTDEAEVVYIDAPHAASGPAYPEVQQYFRAPFFEWWNAVQEGTGDTGSGPMDPNDTTWKYHGMDVSLDFLEKYMQEHGPFDGLMGFSQGASVSALVALLQHKGIKFQGLPKVKFLLLFAGGKCKDPQYEPLYQQAAACDPIPTPGCIFIGDQDQHKAACDAIIPCFGEHLAVIRHPLGHQVPRLTPEQTQQVQRLIQGA